MKLSLSLLFLCMCLSVAQAEEIRVILDTDANNELDDQHAIAYMLFNGDTFHVEAITVNRTRNGGPEGSGSLRSQGKDQGADWCRWII